MPHIIEVTDLAAPELDVYARLTGAQLRNRLEPDKGVFIAESPKVIATALDAGYEPLSLLMERRHIEGDAQPILARCGEIPVYTAERETLARLTGFELTRGVLCAMRRPRLPSVEEVCARARRVAVLEGIVDHTNVGAIFRSAAALGIDAVLVTPTCCDPFYRRAVRVSMGTGFLVFLAGFQNIPGELLEASHIDGVSTRFQELRYIVAPIMRPQMLFSAINSIVGAFSVFDIAVQLCGMPSPNYAAHTIVAHMYDYAFIRFETGYASAVSVVLFVITFTLGRLAMRVFSSKE